MNTARVALRPWHSACALAVVLTLLVTAVTAVPSASAQQDAVDTRTIVHAVPGVVLNFSQDGGGLAEGLEFGDQVVVPRTTVLSDFTATDASTGVVLFGATDVAFPADIAAALIVHLAVDGSVTTTAMPWDVSPLAAGQGRLLVGHGAALPIATVTIEGEGGYSTTTQLGNGQSIVLDLAPSEYTIGVMSGDGPLLTSRITVTDGFATAAWIAGFSEGALSVAQLDRPLAASAEPVPPTDPPVNTDPLASAHSLRATESVFFIPVFAEPNGESFTLMYEYLDGDTIEYPLVNPTYFGNELVLAVTQGVPGDEWAEVLLPVRPQGTTAWIKTADLEWVFHDKTVHLFVEDTTAMVANGLGPIWEFPAQVGRPDRSTPLGKSYIDEVLSPAPSPGYGPAIISLAMFSESINSISSGLPKVSINGTLDPHRTGTAGTSGSLRIRNAELELLVELLGPNIAGTPTTVWESRAAFDAALGSLLGTPTCGGRIPTVDLALGQTPTAGDDVILGTPGSDNIVAGAGNDVICGLGGDDRIWGQAGNDVVHAGDGDDKVRGGDGNDTLYGDGGRDDLNGGRDNDVVRGGAGDDLAVRGGTGDDVVMGDDGDDGLVAGNGGSDMVIGGAGADKVTGGPRPDRVAGGSGDDDVKGNKGADLLFGDTGDDQLFGGPQPDELDGGSGNDSCNGGTEVDQILLASCQTVVAVP